MKKFLLQEREYEGQRSWKTPRYGYRSVAQFTPWKTIGKFDTLYAADVARRMRMTGLFQRRIKHGTVIAIDERGYCAPEYMGKMKKDA